MYQNHSFKTPLQLEQWAEYERITAKRAADAKAKTQIDASIASTLSLSAKNKASFEKNDLLLIEAVGRWKLSNDVREFVAATMVKVLVETPESSRWQTWALGIADRLDESKTQAEIFGT